MSTKDTFKFVLSWAMVIGFVVLINRTRVGHVIVYYSLILMILFILLAEYKQIAPLFSGLKTIGEFNLGTPEGGVK